MITLFALSNGTHSYNCLFLLLDCAATWANLRTSCYKLFYSNHTNQQKAEMACVREGGHLVSVNSEEEMKFVHQLLFTISEAGSADQVYIGMFMLA